MKKSCKLFLLITAIIVFTLIAVSCRSAESISISSSDKFQTTYVIGQDIDFSKATLLVDMGKKTKEISFDEKGVTISGYDKNKLGKQTVTIEYDGVTTEIVVNVVERLTVSGAITDYLIGDSFDKSRGVVKVTADDGTVKNVAFSNDLVKVSGFNSSVANENLALKVVYNLDGNTYEGTLGVNIHPIEAVDFHRPNKISYGSHYEGGADASGGRLIIKGNGGTLKREITITPDMISGLDVSVVNPDNPVVNQKLTVTYNGEEYTYDVEIIYTNISLFRDNADIFNSIPWEGPTEPVIEQAVGELAMDLMTVYFDMIKADRAELDEDIVFNVARAAMMYGFDVWGKDIRQFKGVFAIEYGERVLYLESYDKVKESLQLFEDEESALYTVAPLLLNLIEEYGDRVVYENLDANIRICFNTYPVMDMTDLRVMEAMLNHTLEVYDLVDDIPNDWRETGLCAYYDDLFLAISKIYAESYVLDYSNLYYLISEWRDGNDLFDILYEYLYEIEQANVMKSLVIYGLPNSVSEIYVHLLTAVLAMDDMQNGEYLDTTKLLYNYYITSDLVKLLNEGNSEAEKHLYRNIPVSILFGMDASVNVTFEYMLQYVRTSILDLTEGLAEVETYENIISEYIKFIKNCYDISGFETSAEYGEGIKSLFDKFVALSPVQQYNVISIFNMLYKYGLPELSFDETDDYAIYTSMFNAMINTFMKSQLSEAHAATYDNLILAIEVYANRFDYVGWEQDFKDRMDKVTEAIKLLEGSDKTNFDYYLRSAYDRYMLIRSKIDNKAVLGEWADDFAELHKALKDIQTASYIISNSEKYNYNYFLAAFEKASRISENILKNAPSDIIYAYYYEPLFEAYLDESESQVFWTYDYALNLYRGVYSGTLLTFGAQQVNIYDSYYNNKLDDFLSVYYIMVSDYLNKTEEQPSSLTKTEFLAVMEAFCELDSKTKALFMTLEGNVDLFGTARAFYADEMFSAKAADIAKKLFALENAMLNYEVSPSGTALNTIRELLTELKDAYSHLEGEDKISFASLETIYSYYTAKAEQLVA